MTEELRRIGEETVRLTYRFDRSPVPIERLAGIKPVWYFYPHGAVTDLYLISPPPPRLTDGVTVPVALTRACA